jgi:two-component system NtrC family sensor kinase
MQKEEAPLKGSQEEKIAAIRQFAVGLTDEMSNLLIVISGRLRILLEQKTIDKDIRGALDTISNCTDRLSEIVNRILKFAMNMPQKFENLNINEIIESVFTLLNYHKVYSTSVSIEKDLAKDLPLVKGDVNQLQEAFLDLLLNAYQAMAGRGKLTVKTSNFQNHHIEIKISYRGCEILDESLENISKPPLFKKKEWIDFDLLFCHKVINNLNGSIDIESQENYGTTVIIRLPFV